MKGGGKGGGGYRANLSWTSNDSSCDLHQHAIRLHASVCCMVTPLLQIQSCCLHNKLQFSPLDINSIGTPNDQINVWQGEREIQLNCDREKRLKLSACLVTDMHVAGRMVCTGYSRVARGRGGLRLNPHQSQKCWNKLLLVWHPVQILKKNTSHSLLGLGMAHKLCHAKYRFDP